MSHHFHSTNDESTLLRILYRIGFEEGFILYRCVVKFWGCILLKIKSLVIFTPQMESTTSLIFINMQQVLWSSAISMDLVEKALTDVSLKLH